MGKPTEVGVRLPVAGPLANPSAARETAVLCEELGYHAVWVNDFLAWTTYQDQHHVSCGSVEARESSDAPPLFIESLTNLAYLAGVTERIRLGIAVLVSPTEPRLWLPSSVVVYRGAMREFTRTSVGTVTSIVMAISTFPQVVFAVLAVELIREFDVDRWQIGALVTATGVTGALFAPWLGHVTDRMGALAATGAY